MFSNLILILIIFIKKVNKFTITDWLRTRVIFESKKCPGRDFCKVRHSKRRLWSRSGFFKVKQFGVCCSWSSELHFLFRALFWRAGFRFDAAMTGALTQPRCGWRADRTLLECSRGRPELSEVCLLQSPTLDYQSTEVSAFLPRRSSSSSTRASLFSHRRAAGWLDVILFQSLWADSIRHLWWGVSSCVLGFGTVAAVDPFRDAALWSFIPGRKPFYHYPIM